MASPAEAGGAEIVPLILAAVEDTITVSVPTFAQTMARMVVPYHLIEVFVNMDSLALALWILRHFGIFVSFYAFANPIYSSIGDKEATYSVGLLVFTFLMLCMTLYHFSDPAGVPLHTRDAINFTFPALAYAAPVMFLVDCLMRVCLKRTLFGSSRAIVGNLMLVVCCLCTQYAYCVSTKPGGRAGLVAVVGKGTAYCSTFEEPQQFPLATLGTLFVVCLWSALFNCVFRHGIILVEPVQPAAAKLQGRIQRGHSLVNLGCGDMVKQAKDEQMSRLMEHRPSMSAWYSVNLASTVGLMFVQFKIFLGRFDVRTMRAALSGVHHVEAMKPARPFEGRSELWFDFVADTGDGFNSTFSIARCLAQPVLDAQVKSPQILTQIKKKMERALSTVAGQLLGKHKRSHSSGCISKEETAQEHEVYREMTRRSSKPVLKRQTSGDFSDASGGNGLDKRLSLPRGELLLHGGDLAYPHPSLDVYEQRLLLPYEAALSPPSGANTVEVASKTGAAGEESRRLAEASHAPKCWMIPGNHDWFDGLEAFLHTICGRHWFGGWHLPQTNTYWALELPHRWFVFGFDLGLNDDLDDMQYSYFSTIIRELPPDANVISVTHGPHWWIDAYCKRESGRMHQQILAILGPRLRLLLAGDIHNYSRYSPRYCSPRKTNGKVVRGGGPELVTSGGGGAFLHPTHLDVEVPDYRLAATYPSPAISRSLALRNPVQFRRRNWAFEIALGGVMVFSVMPALPLCGDAEAAYKSWGTVSGAVIWLELVGRCYVRIFESTTVALIAQIGMALFMVGFPEPHWGKGRALLWGVPLGLAISLCAVGCACGLELAVVALGAGEKVMLDGSDTPDLVRNLPPPWSDLLLWFLPRLLWIVDLPTHVFEARSAVCAAGAVQAPRSLFLLYELLMVPYFWVLVTPLATTIFGCYLALASLWGRHVDEAFSSLRVENFKNFLRFHIDSDGGLHLYSLGIGWVARQWEEDWLWRKELDQDRPPAKRSTPSRWKPSSPCKPVLVDYVHLPGLRSAAGQPAPGPAPGTPGPAPDGTPQHSDAEAREVRQKGVGQQCDVM